MRVNRSKIHYFQQGLKVETRHGASLQWCLCPNRCVYCYICPFELTRWTQ
jgi:hypothetical protein